jgi:hypothetical protein
MGIGEYGADSTVQELLTRVTPEIDVRRLSAVYRRVCGGPAGWRLVLAHGTTMRMDRRS